MIDDLIRRALSGDVPEEVEARLERRVGLFLESRRRPGRSRMAIVLLDLLAVTGVRRLRWGREALAVTSALLVACGIVLHLAGSRSAFADSLAQMNVQVSLAHAIRLAPPAVWDLTIGADGGVRVAGVIEWTSGGEARVDLRRGEERIALSVGSVTEILTAEGLAERVYRDWILLRSEPGPESALVVFVFRSPKDGALIELVAEGRTLTPRVIRKVVEGSGEGRGEGAQGFSAVFTRRNLSAAAAEE